MIQSLKQKFQELACKKVPTGDPDCSSHIRLAQRVFRKIVVATNGSTDAGSDIGSNADSKGAESEYDNVEKDEDDDGECDDEDEDGDNDASPPC